MNLEKRLEWCLKKGAEKKRKHRGLRITEPDIKRSKRHLEKAEHNTKLLEKIKEMKDFNDWIFPVAFYSMYHACLAVLTFFGYESRNQECTFIVLEKLINEGKINLSMDDINVIKRIGIDVDKGDMKTLREDFQYGTEVKAEEELVNNAVKSTKDFVSRAKSLLYVLFGEV